MTKNKNILIYTENVHDVYSMNIIELSLLNDCNIFLITELKKYERLKKTNLKIIKQITFIELKNNTIKADKIFKKIYSKIVRIIHMFNNREIFKKAVHHNKISTIIFLEDYNERFMHLLKNDLMKFKTIKKILTVHNSDKYVKEYEIYKTIFEKFSLGKPKSRSLKFFNVFDNYLVLTKKMKEQFTKFTKKDSKIIPFSLTEKKDYELREKNIQILKNKEKVTFLVPGNVQSKRKNYYQIIDVFSKIESKDYELIFLGSVIEAEIIKYAKLNAVEIVCFQEYIIDSKFTKIISMAHFLLGIVSNKLPYGIFKCSGVEFDGPKYGVPVIINDENVSSDKGVYIQTNNLFETIKALIFECNSGQYYEKYGKPAFEKMKENGLENYMDTIKQLI